jgi:hypothetical protein
MAVINLELRTIPLERKRIAYLLKHNTHLELDLSTYLRNFLAELMVGRKKEKSGLKAFRMIAAFGTKEGMTSYNALYGKIVKFQTRIIHRGLANVVFTTITGADKTIEFAKQEQKLRNMSYIKLKMRATSVVIREPRS